MADQSAAVLYDPAKTDPSQLVSAFAGAKASGESRFTLTVESGSVDAAAQESGGTSDTSNDFAPPLPPGAPEFGETDGAGASEASAPVGGGDFDVSLEAPAE